MFDLSGRVAVVTGALGRLGPVWCRALSDAGARVHATDLAGAVRSEAFDALARDCPERVWFGPADVLDRGSLERALSACEERFGPPDILVNNAGIDQPPEAGAARHRIEDIPDHVWQRVLGVNVVGAFQACQVFGGAMCRHRRGSIINIGSLYASVSPDARLYEHLRGDPPFVKPPAYGASKAALVNLTRYLATHWAQAGVRVNALSPGGVLGEQDDQFRAKFTSRVPLGRMAEAHDLGGPLVFLASDAASYVTGIELRVDGGYTAW